MIARVHGAADGESHFTELTELPFERRRDDGTLTARMLTGVPASKLDIRDLAGPLPFADFHFTVPRKLIVVLRGEIEVTAGDGERRRFGRGDCLLTDDIGSKGHSTSDVGDEPLLTVIVELGDDWEFPGTP